MPRTNIITPVHFGFGRFDPVLKRRTGNNETIAVEVSGRVSCDALQNRESALGVNLGWKHASTGQGNSPLNNRRVSGMGSVPERNASHAQGNDVATQRRNAAPIDETASHLTTWAPAKRTSDCKWQRLALTRPHASYPNASLAISLVLLKYKIPDDSFELRTLGFLSTASTINEHSPTSIPCRAVPSKLQRARTPPLPSPSLRPQKAWPPSVAPLRP